MAGLSLLFNEGLGAEAIGLVHLATSTGTSISGLLPGVYLQS